MASLAQSVRSVPHSRIRELAEIAFRMDGVLKLYFGESNQPTPEYIKRAAIQAMESGYTFYTENAGLLSLRLHLQSSRNWLRAHFTRLCASAKRICRRGSWRPHPSLPVLIHGPA